MLFLPTLLLGLGAPDAFGGGAGTPPGDRALTTRFAPMTSRTVCLIFVLLGLRFAFRFSGGGGGTAVEALDIPLDTGAPNSSLCCPPGVDGIGEILLPRLVPLNAAAALTASMLAVDVRILLGLTRCPAASGGGGGTMLPKDWS